MTTMFEHFSVRSKMLIFLTRKDAGRRGATALEPGNLLEAIINEDQGEFAKRFAGHSIQSEAVRAPEPFFSAEASANALLRLHKILPQQEPIADTVDMAMSPGLQHILEAATALAQKLHHRQVEPLHLVAAILAEESSGTAEILRESGISKEAVMQALRKLT